MRRKPVVILVYEVILIVVSIVLLEVFIMVVEDVSVVTIKYMMNKYV
jgi:hypothetical protein